MPSYIDLSSVIPEIETFGGGDASVAEIVRALDSGRRVESWNEYGVPVAWKQEDGSYRCIEVQYGPAVGDARFLSAEEAAGWFIEVHRQTNGLDEYGDYYDEG